VKWWELVPMGISVRWPWPGAPLSITMVTCYMIAVCSTNGHHYRLSNCLQWDQT